MEEEKEKLIKKIGNLPINASITLDYPKDNRPPTIKFDYPAVENQIKKLKWSSLLFIPALILAIFTTWSLVQILDYNNPYKGFPDSCTATKIGNQSFVDELELVCNYSSGRMINQTYTIDREWYEIEPTFSSLGYNNTASLLIILGSLFFGVIMFLGWNFVLVRVLRGNKKAQEIWPELNKKVHDKNFTKEITSLRSKVFELPLFTNTYLDYEAEEDFGEYLNRVEIRPHEFKYQKNKKDMNPSDNFSLWKATFYFDKVPKKGKLKLWWT